MMTGQLSRRSEQLQPKPQLIQLHEPCFPYAEAGDWLHLYPSEHFPGEGVYVLQYVRPTSTWQGMRGVRCGPQGLEIEERSGWAPIGEHRSVLRFVGRVEKVRAEPVQVLQDLNLPPS